LRCPGCYAYDPAHLGGGITLRDLSDRKGTALIDGILELVERYKPLHLSLVGGDPLVRYRELEVLVPRVLQRGIHVQIVTSAFRPLPAAWAGLPHLNIAVSIDGLAPEHDRRRAPATYERILRNIEGHRITIHCTITGPMMRSQREPRVPGESRPMSYLEEFLAFWTPKPEIQKVWFSLFTPQTGDRLDEILTADERRQAIQEMLTLRRKYPKLDMPEVLIHQFETPPSSPDDCTFAQTTATVSADLKTEIGPCQFGGNPDCSNCGCMASMGLAAVASARIAGIIPVGQLFKASLKIGRALGASGSALPVAQPEFRVLQ
jgi:sulfatase maturation enzyme AslB (radical SAM superfamily)